MRRHFVLAFSPVRLLHEPDSTPNTTANGLKDGLFQHRWHPDVELPIVSHGMGPNPGGGPDPCAAAPNPTGRAATAASPAPTPGRYAARAAGQNLSHLQSAAIVRRALHQPHAAPLIRQTGGTQGPSGGWSALAGAHGRATRVAGAVCLWPWCAWPPHAVPHPPGDRAATHGDGHHPLALAPSAL